MKLNVKIGEFYARVEISDGADKKLREDITYHIQNCPQCISLIHKKGKKHG